MSLSKFSLSKRIALLTNLASVICLAGVFLLFGMIFSNTVHASSDPLFSTPTPISPLREDENKVDKLKETFESKKDLVQDRVSKVEEAQKEAKIVADVKTSLLTQVTDIKSEVAHLKAKLEEKRRLEAMRIVKIGIYSPDASGNLYAPGNCTWYAKSRRPDLPNNLGNAHMWYANAKAQGWKTGKQSKKGAIGVSFEGPLGHVVYVEAWYPDGTVLISEMNYKGLYVISSRVVAESEFIYIYGKS